MIHGRAIDVDRTDELLREWRWLVPEAHHVFVTSIFGDLFLVGRDGRIFWLDVATGQEEEIASDITAFEALLADQEEADFYFSSSLARRCAAAGLTPGPTECLSYVQLPMFGGAYEPENFAVRPLQEHLDNWGPICRAASPVDDVPFDESAEEGGDGH